MADASEVGRYGTIRLMKRNEPDAVVASYPIDDEVVTFGRDPTCSVRLYYQWVSTLHCKIIFEERKAFLQVMGGNGVVVDGCQVLPIRSGASSEPITIPLIHGSSFVIHKKRFVFNYPPKELRPHLFTPAAKRRGSLRLSMISSAQVFSPRPSLNPRENLRILQSPLKPFVGAGSGDDEVVKLVDGNHPKVLEEEQDLVILENVENASPAKVITPPQPQVTPRRKSIPSLHRAVLIRSAQRAQQHLNHRPVLHDVDEAIDPDLEDAVEEEEVEEAVVALALSEESEEEPESSDALLLEDEDDEFEASGKDAMEWTSEDDHQEETEDDFEEHTTSTIGSPSLLEHRRPMPSLFSRHSEERTPRKSGPQRPPPGSRFSLAPKLEEDEDGLTDPLTGSDTNHEDDNIPTPMRPIVSPEERQAIIERRKSAMKGPTSDFEHIPGSRRTSALPPPPQQSPFKKIGKGIDDGEETTAVLARMQETLDDMRTKKSSAKQGSPGIGRGQGFLSSPAKPAFSLLARGASPRMRSPVFTRETRQTPILEDEHTEDADEGGDVDSKMGSHLLGDHFKKGAPQTPRLDGVRDLFRVSAVPATPSFRGMRELFGKTDNVPKQVRTPRLDGVREMFTEVKKVESPRYDGVEDMMAIPEEGEVDLSDNGIAYEVENSEVVRPMSLKATRSIPKTNGRNRSRPLRGNVTDSSIMADDEASILHDPAVGARQLEDTSEIVAPQRSVRPRRPKVQPSEDDVDIPADQPKTKNRRARTRATEENDASATTEQGCSTSPADATPEVEAPKPHRKAPMASSADNDQPEPKTRRRTTKKPSEDDGSSSSAVPRPVDGRRTRSRGASVEQRDEEDPLDSIPRESSPERPVVATKPRRGTRAKPSKEVDVVESIPETDEQEPAPPPVRKALGRTRRVKEEPSDDVDNNPKKKAGAGRKKVVDEDGGETVQGKENTPDPSPISPTDAGAGFKDDKRAEKASKTSKVKTEEKTTTTTRATRARSRK